MSINSSDVRLIGVIGKPHGINGEVTVKVLTGYPNFIEEGDVLYLTEDCKVEIIVSYLREKKIKDKKILIFKFAGYDDRNAAESIRGSLLFRISKKSKQSKENQFWIDDLINCEVYTTDEKYIGIVINVEKYYSNDNLVINTEDKNKLKNKKENIIFIPMLNDYIDDINIRNKKIKIKKIPEYI